MVEMDTGQAEGHCIKPSRREQDEQGTAQAVKQGQLSPGSGGGGNGILSRADLPLLGG